MYKIERFVNDLMTSNCYVIVHDIYPSCIIVDPGSEKSVNVINYIENNKLNPEYIILTHEHTDHTWGCNILKEKYKAKVVCSQSCKELLPEAGRSYFQFYFDNINYKYIVKDVDIILEDVCYLLNWNKQIIKFTQTPGHSEGSVIFSIENNLFTGDTIMQFKPFFPKRNGSIKKYKESIKKIFELYDPDKTIVYPGHGNVFLLKDFEYKLSDD